MVLRFHRKMLHMQAIEELKQANLDEEGVEALQKLYNEVRAEEEKARENKEREAAAQPDAARPSQKSSEALKIGGLAHGIISRLLITLKLMHDVRAFLNAGNCMHVLRA